MFFLQKNNLKVKNFLLYFFLILTLTSKSQISDFDSIDFTRADNIAKLYEGESLENIPILSYNLTHNLNTDVEKFRSIFFWVCNNIIADEVFTSRVLHKREKFKNDSLSFITWNKKNKKKFFKRLLKQKRTICSGYAFLIKELCFFANIECEIIDGYGRTIESNVETLNIINHSWNAVKLNNKWYLCDATWASGYSEIKGPFVKKYNEGYFLTEPKLFKKSHIPINQKWTLLNFAEDSENIPPLVYGETYELNIDPILPSVLKLNFKTGDEITFSYKKLNNDLDPSLVEMKGFEEIRFNIYDIKKNDNITTFKYAFNKKGNYDVHLKVGNYIVATYIIKVEN